MALTEGALILCPKNPAVGFPKIQLTASERRADTGLTNLMQKWVRLLALKLTGKGVLVSKGDFHLGWWLILLLHL